MKSLGPMNVPEERRKNRRMLIPTMKKNRDEEKLPYVKPQADIIEFELKESIADSLNFGPSTLCGEETW